ncbi:MAG: MFS transporter [Bacillota bacterium]
MHESEHRMTESAAGHPPARLGREQTAPKGNWMVGVLVLSVGWLLLYATRTALSSALKDIGDFWGLSEGYLGFLSSSFFFSYMLLQIPSGLLADRFGSRRMILVGFGIQAVGLLSGVLARSPFQFLLARVLTGAGQATYFACQQAILSFTLPPERRAGGVAVTTAGAGIGSALGFLLGKFLSAFSLGWKMPFVALGVISAAFILVVMVAVPEPRSRRKPDNSAPGTVGSRGEDASPIERSAQVEKGPASRRTASRRDEFERAASGRIASWRPDWGFLAFMSLSHFLTMYGFYLMLSWLPYYLETVRGLQGGLSAVVPIVMPLMMAPSTILWGVAADKRKNRDFVLKICLPIAAAATAAIPFMGASVTLAAVLALYGATGKLVIDPVLVSAVSENAPPESRGAILATFNSSGSLAMILAPSVTGLIAQWTGSFDVSFYAAGAFNLIALASFLLGMRVLRSAEGAAAGAIPARM